MSLSKLDRAKILLAISKAKTAKQELEMRIMEREIDMDRMREHIKLQDVQVAELSARLKD